MPLDAHDRKDDDRRGFFRSVAAPEAHYTPLVGEFDNGAHLAAPAVVRNLPAAAPLIPALPAPASAQVSGMQG